MPDAYDEYLARKKGGASPAVAEDPSEAMRSFYAGKQEDAGVREAPKAEDPYDAYLAKKPIDLDTKRDLIRRLGLSQDVDPDFKDQNPRWHQAIDDNLDRVAPGLSKASMLHAERIRKALPEDAPPTAGETATALAGDFNRSFMAPARGIADKMFGSGGPLENEAAHDASQGFGTGDNNPRLAKAREALDKTFVGRMARGVVALPGMITNVKAGTKALGAGGVLSGEQAGMGAMGLYAGESEGSVEAGGGGVAMAALGGGLSKGMTGFMAGLDPVKKSIALQKIASVGTEGAGWAVSDAILNGPDGERALTNFLFGAGLSLSHGARSVVDRVEANRARTMEGIDGEGGMPAGRITPGLESGPLPDEVTRLRPELPAGEEAAALPQGALAPEGSREGTYPLESPPREDVRGAIAKGRALPAPGTPPPVEPQFARENVGRPFTTPDPTQWSQPPSSPPNAAGAVENVGKRGKSGPTKPVISPENPAIIDPDAIQMPKGRTQRGAVGGPLTAEEAGRVDRARETIKAAARGLGRAARATGESFMGTGLNDMRREAPTGGRYFAKASSSREYGDAVGTILEAKVTQGMKKEAGEKYAGEKFGYAMVEEELRSLEDSYRDKGDGAKHGARFKALYPTDAELQKTWSDPAYRDFVDRHQAVFDQAVEPMNRQATGKDFDGMGRGVVTGARGNLVPLSEQPGLLGIRANKGGVRSSTVGKEATGGAFDYDPRLSNRYAHAVRQAWEITNTKAAIEGMVKDKAAEWYDGNPNRRPPAGWVPYDVVATAGQVRIVDSGGQPAAGKTLYVKPELAHEIENFDRMNKVPKGRGLFTMGQKALTAIQLASPVDKVFHTLNLAAVNYRVGGKNPLAFTSHYKAFADPVVRATAMKRLAEIGASKPHYESGGIRKWLDSEKVDRVMDKARLYDLDRVDLAVRTAILDNVENLIRKGLVPDTLEARRGAVLQAGNYNARTQDWVVRVLKGTGLQPFAVASRTMFSNAVRASPLGRFSKGVEATGAAAATRLRGEVALKWAAYLAAASMNNWAITGNFMPLGFGRWVSPFGKDDQGNYREWGLPSAATGFGRMMSASGTQGVVDTVSEGGTLGEGVAKGAKSMGNAVVRSVAGGPGLEAGATAAGLHIGFGHYGGVGSGEADPGKAAREVNAWVDAIVGVIKGDEMGHVAHEAFGPMFPRTRK